MFSRLTCRKALCRKQEIYAQNIYGIAKFLTLTIDIAPFIISSNPTERKQPSTFTESCTNTKLYTQSGADTELCEIPQEASGQFLVLCGSLYRHSFPVYYLV